DWKLPDVVQVRNSLDFEELFSEKFLMETLRALIGDKDKISQKPLKEQVTHYEKLKQYMDQLMKSAPDTTTTNNTNAHPITAITTLIAHCVVFTSKFIKHFSEKVDLSNVIGIAVFSNGEDIMLHFH
ncbi:hypothetical protein H5202_23355, partial [Shewanella sp. SG41-4]|uniref:hypothetical protein n=1 Tax=Shewanella sp. SG41-4 TaxID=2760976 RepID=UPI0016021A26